MAKVKFVQGLASAYTGLEEKDQNTFYYTTDDKKLYLGTIELANPENLATQLAKITTLENEIKTLTGGGEEGSIQDQIDAAIEQLKTDVIGSLTDLSTEVQDKVVAAINEVDANADAAKSAADAAQKTATAAQTAAEEAKTQSVVTVEKEEAAEEGAIVSYVVKQNGVQVGSKINVPKDVVVKSGKIVDIEGVKNLEITLSDADETKINIPVGELADVYTAENAEGAKVNVTVNDEHKISAALAADVTASLGKADTALQASSIVEGTIEGAIEVNGTAVNVHGLKDLAYKEEADLGLGDLAKKNQTELEEALDAKYDATGAAETAKTNAVNEAKQYTDSQLEWGTIE